MRGTRFLQFEKIQAVKKNASKTRNTSSTKSSAVTSKNQQPDSRKNAEKTKSNPEAHVRKGKYSSDGYELGDEVW
jgi:hypothetical protein